MKQASQPNMLQIIEQVYDQSKHCMLEETHFKKLENELQPLAEYLGTNQQQAFFVAIYIVTYLKGDDDDLIDLARYFDCNPLRLLHYVKDLKALEDRCVLMRKEDGNMIPTRVRYLVNDVLVDAVLKDMPVPTLSRPGFKDVYELLEKVYKIGRQRKQEIIMTFILEHNMTRLMRENMHFSLIHMVDALQLKPIDNFHLLLVIWKTLIGDEREFLPETLETAFDRSSSQARYFQALLSGENKLIKHKLLEIVSADFLDFSKIKLGKEALQMLKRCDMRVSQRKQHGENTILPQQIMRKSLYFNREETAQLGQVEKLLYETNLKKVRRRLSSTKMSGGITVLFHGAAGTGKTEMVMQLARRTGRTLIKVDISQSKSMWYGESEKLIKGIFSSYSSVADSCDLAPILFFNEADAIISSRVEHSKTTFDKTENAVQNILLEEIEQFDGILIATTNLVQNLDTAFDRRFLFKVLFNKPEPAVKASIWKYKLPHLSKEKCLLLAKQHDFSGGQIDNIARKCEMHMVLNGRKATMAEVHGFCDKEELMLKHNTSIGFRRVN